MNVTNITKFTRNYIRLSEGNGIENQEDAFTVIAVLSLASNLLLLAVLMGVPKLRRPVNYLVGNLCVSSVFYTLTGCIRLAELKGILILRGYGCLIWRASQKLGSWVTANALISISLHECYMFSHLNGRLRETTCYSAFAKIACSWIVAIVTSSYTVASFSYDSSASVNASCNKAIFLEYPQVDLWENLTAFTVFYLWSSFHITCELYKIRWDIRDFLCGKFETRHRLRCADNIELQRRLKQLKYIICYSMIYLLFWVPQGISELIWSFLNVTDPKGSYSELYWIKGLLDNSRHPMVCIFPVVFLLLSCSLEDFKLCFGTCLVSPIQMEHHGGYSQEDAPIPEVNFSNWDIHGGENTANVELPDSQFSERDKDGQLESQL